MRSPSYLSSRGATVDTFPQVQAMCVGRRCLTCAHCRHDRVLPQVRGEIRTREESLRPRCRSHLNFREFGKVGGGMEA
jgi:hypothetical protein